MRNTVLFFLTVVISQLLNAQTIYPILNIPVTKNQRVLRQPWCGGLNSPQLTQGDLNGDGIPDLFAFDRNGD